MSNADAQGALWSAAAQEWADTVEPQQTPYYRAAFDAAGLTRGMRLLDAGCGAGLALELAYARGASVTGVDAAAGLLNVARSRLPDAVLLQGDLEKLPLADDEFDIATAFNSVQFAADPVQALREIQRVAKPGAPVAITTWGPPEKCELSRVLAAVAALVPAPSGGIGPFALSGPGALAALLARAGLRPERTVDVPTPFVFPDMGSAVRAQLSPGGARRAIGLAGEAAVRQALSDSLAQFQLPDGSLRLENEMRVVVARA